MSSILSSAKKIYPLFYKNGQWYNDYMGEVFSGKVDVQQRIVMIQKLFEIILNSSKSNEIIRKWVTTPFSIQDVARCLKLSESAVKSRLYYFNNTIGHAMVLEGENMLNICVLSERIDWEKMNLTLDGVYCNAGKRLSMGKALIEKKDMLVYIPRKAPVRLDISDKEFNDFIKLFSDYFIVARKKRQTQIESKPELCGYFWYLLSGGNHLSAEEIARRDKILKLAGKEIPVTDASVEKIPVTAISVENNPGNDADDNEIIDWGYDEHGVKTTHVQFNDF